MAHTKSSKKDIRRIKTRTVKNKGLRSKMRTYVRKARTSIEGGDDSKTELVKASLIALDKMESKGTIKKNNASRRKSRLMKQLNVALGIVEPTVLKSKIKKPAERVAARLIDQETTEHVDASVISETIVIEDEVIEKETAEVAEVEEEKLPD
jgi:small subunit ribosomal protein S20